MLYYTILYYNILSLPYYTIQYNTVALKKTLLVAWGSVITTKEFDGLLRTCSYIRFLSIMLHFPCNATNRMAVDSKYNSFI